MELFPMNAQRPNERKLREIMGNEQYVAEIKWNGYRQVFKEGELLSRSVGVDGKQKAKTEWVPHITQELIALGDYWFDGELLLYPGGTSHDVTRIMQSSRELAIEKQQDLGMLTYMLFDVLHTPTLGYIADKPFEYRRKVLEQTYDRYLKGHPWIRLSVVYQHDRIQETIDRSKALGLEGVMLKRLSGLWVPGTATTDSRPANNWYKIKHEIDGEDCIITGFVPPEMYYRGEGGKADTNRTTKYYNLGWIGGVRIGQYQRGVLVDVGSFSGISDELRRDMSEHPKKYLNRVVTVKAFGRNASGHFTSPVFQGFRDDKKPTECVWQ